jgi:hypothetical protein
MSLYVCPNYKSRRIITLGHVCPYYHTILTWVALYQISQYNLKRDILAMHIIILISFITDGAGGCAGGVDRRVIAPVHYTCRRVSRVNNPSAVYLASITTHTHARAVANWASPSKAI